MTLEGAQSHIWCPKIGWQTVPCSWSIDGEAVLTGSSPGVWDQQSHRRRETQLLATMHGVHRHTHTTHETDSDRPGVFRAIPGDGTLAD